MEHNEKSKNGHIYFYSVKSTGNLSMDDYRKNKFKDLNLKSNDMLITYAFNDGNPNVGITTGSQVRKYLSDDDAINVLRENSDSLKSNNPDDLSKGLFTILSKYETYQDKQRQHDLLKKIIYTIVFVVFFAGCLCAELAGESDPSYYDYDRSYSSSSDEGDTGGGSI